MGLGQLGDGTTISRTAPVQVSGLGSVTAIAAGNGFSLAAKEDGTVWAWGINGWGQLGDGTTTSRSTPVQVTGPGGSGVLGSVTAVAGGWAHSLARQADGTVWAWGINGLGQLGIGASDPISHPTPLHVGGVSGADGIAAGYGHSLASGNPTISRTVAYGYDRLYRLTSASPVVTTPSPEGIRRSVVNQLRRDVDGWRQGVGLSRYLWTDPTLTETVPLRDDHFLDLRNALRAIPGNESLQYTAGDPSPSRTMKLSDIADVRGWLYGNAVTTTYTYDPAGNRISMTVGVSTTAYAYDRADRIQQAGSTAYTVNANGNQVARGSDSFVYDQANRLITAPIGLTTTRYVYDGDGKRASKTVGVATTTYVYDVNRSLPVLLDDGERKYVWSSGIAYAVDIAANVLVYQLDGLGSVRATTSVTGSVLQTYRADEFGAPVATLGSGTQPFQYAGEQRDGETALYYLRARIYDPLSGRFLSRDPLGGTKLQPDSFNRYTYAGNNPVVNTDPSGLCTDPGGPGIRYCIQTFIPQTSWGGPKGDARTAVADNERSTFRTALWIFQRSDGSTTSRVELGVSVFLPTGLERRGVMRFCGAAKSRVLGGRALVAMCSVHEGHLGVVAPPIRYQVLIDEALTGTGVHVWGTPFPSMEIWQYWGEHGSANSRLLFYYDAYLAGTDPATALWTMERLPNNGQLPTGW